MQIDGWDVVIVRPVDDINQELEQRRDDPTWSFSSSYESALGGGATVSAQLAPFQLGSGEGRSVAVQATFEKGTLTMSGEGGAVFDIAGAQFTITGQITTRYEKAAVVGFYLSLGDTTHMDLQLPERLRTDGPVVEQALTAAILTWLKEGTDPARQGVLLVAAPEGTHDFSQCIAGDCQIGARIDGTKQFLVMALSQRQKSPSDNLVIDPSLLAGSTERGVFVDQGFFTRHYLRDLLEARLHDPRIWMEETKLGRPPWTIFNLKNSNLKISAIQMRNDMVEFEASLFVPGDSVPIIGGIGLREHIKVQMTVICDHRNQRLKFKTRRRETIKRELLKSGVTGFFAGIFGVDPYTGYSDFFAAVVDFDLPLKPDASVGSAPYSKMPLGARVPLDLRIDEGGAQTAIFFRQLAS